jgi:hypothetical protein
VPRVAIVVSLLLVLAACGDDSGGGTTVAPTTTAGGTSTTGFPEGAFAFAASSDLGVGTERLLVAVSDDSGARLPSPDIDVTLEVSLDGSDAPTQTADTTFMWAIENVSGLYRAMVEFDQPGIWTVVATPVGGEPLEPFQVAVNTDPATVNVGEPAPRSETPTVADAPLEQISSDPDPDPSFYELSVADAVESGRPTVIAFATPRFCQTAICGPTLDRIKEMAPAFPGVNFVHVEVFTNLDDPSNLETVPAVIEWGLPTEPWVFVVDEAGIVSARFEGLVTTEELEAALE